MELRKSSCVVAAEAVTAPHFARAYEAGTPWSQELNALTQRPAVASALRDAATTAANEGRALPTVVLDGSGTWSVRMPRSRPMKPVRGRWARLPCRLKVGDDILLR